MSKKNRSESTTEQERPMDDKPPIEIGSHLGEDVRRVMIGLAVCGVLLVLMKLTGM